MQINQIQLNEIVAEGVTAWVNWPDYKGDTRTGWFSDTICNGKYYLKFGWSVKLLYYRAATYMQPSESEHNLECNDLELFVAVDDNDVKVELTENQKQAIINSINYE